MSTRFLANHGTSGIHGRRECDWRRPAPLIYSTELARSVKLDYAASVREKGKTKALLKADEIEIKATSSGGKYRPLDETPISTDLIYDLVNVRTDGTRILCATMEEKGNQFDIQCFAQGVEP